MILFCSRESRWVVVVFVVLVIVMAGVVVAAVFVSWVCRGSCAVSDKDG